MEINISDEVGSLAKPFHCTSCSKSFAVAKTLEEHILNKHVEDKEFQCKECLQDKKLSKFFATQQILNKHLKRVHGPIRSKCHVCLKTFSNSSNLALHIKRTHSQPEPHLKKHTCDICSKQFKFNYELQTHLFLVHKQKKENVTYLHCEFCSQEYLDRGTLEKHVIRHHVADKAFECSVCSKTFIDQETLEKHMKRHDTEIKYFCDVCSNGFKMKKTLNRHLGVQHNRFFYCEKCLRSFKNKPDFDEHIFNSKTELKCHICQQLFSSECNLILHTDSHSKEIKPEKNGIKVENEFEPSGSSLKVKVESATKIECQLCSKTFDREAYFRAHRREVHPNAEWKCNFDECTKSFTWYSQLKKHKMMHAETKQFACNICGKSFHRPDSLSQHEQVHLEEKEHKCEICLKSFSTPFRQRVHIANNHGGPKPFKCPIINCGTSWASNSELKMHLISHETKRSFKCEICQSETKFMAFKSLGQLKGHQRTVHSTTKKTRARGFPSQNLKQSDAVFFICSSNKCSFETGSEAEVALHYNQQHQLPKVCIFRNSSSSSPSSLV